MVGGKHIFNGARFVFLFYVWNKNFLVTRECGGNSKICVGALPANVPHGYVVGLVNFRLNSSNGICIQFVNMLGILCVHKG